MDGFIPVNDLPTISIITPCLNRAKYIATAVESVLQQDYPNVEHIIVDGISTDGTLEILQQYSHLHIHSEPDSGMYDAINKGIKMATGEIIGVINTDDLYEPNILAPIANIFINDHDINAVLGGAIIFRDIQDGNQEIVTHHPSYTQGEFLSQVTTGVPIFNAWFFRKDMFDRYGLFDTRYRYAADRDFLIRLAIDELQYICLGMNVYRYRHHPGSFTINHENTAESQVYFEDRFIAEDYLSQKGISTKKRQYFLGWHSQITSNQTLYALSQRNLRKTFSYILRGWTHNLWWPIVFIRSVFDSIGRFIRSAA